MAAEADSLLMRIALDAEGVRKGVSEVQESTSKLDGIGKQIGSLGSTIRGAFAFAGINLGLKALARNSDELQEAMKPLHELLGKFGDQLAPGFRILGGAIKDITGHFDKMSQAVGAADFVARAFAVTMELVRVLLIGLVNGFIFLYNVLRLVFQGAATAIAFLATGVLAFFEKVFEGWEKLARLFVAVGKWLWQEIRNNLLLPLEEGFAKFAKMVVSVAGILPEELQTKFFGKTASQMQAFWQSVDDAADTAQAKQKSLAELYNETEGKMGVLTDATNFFKDSTAIAADVTKMKWEDTKTAFQGLGDNLMELSISDVWQRIQNAALGVGDAFRASADKSNKALDDMGNKAKKEFDMSAGVARAMGNVVAQSFQMLAEKGSLSIGSLAGFMLNAFGDLAIQIGSFVIGSALAISALKASLFGAPGAAIALGLALIAIGGLMKGFASKFGGEGVSAGGAGGGGIGAATAAGTGELVQEADVSEAKKPDTRVVVNITGADLVPRDQWQSVVREHIAPAIQRIVRDEGVTVIDGVFPSGV